MKNSTEKQKLRQFQKSLTVSPIYFYVEKKVFVKRTPHLTVFEYWIKLWIIWRHSCENGALFFPDFFLIKNSAWLTYDMISSSFRFFNNVHAFRPGLLAFQRLPRFVNNCQIDYILICKLQFNTEYSQLFKKMSIDKKLTFKCLLCSVSVVLIFVWMNQYRHLKWKHN